MRGPFLVPLAATEIWNVNLYMKDPLNPSEETGRVTQTEPQ